MCDAFCDARRLIRLSGAGGNPANAQVTHLSTIGRCLSIGRRNPDGNLAAAGVYNPGMRSILGAARLFVTVVIVLIGALCVLLAALLRLQHNGAPLAAWVCTWVARIAMVPFGIRYRCHNPEVIRTHSGLLLPNHITLWDILMVLHVAPMRFLSNLGNKSIPVIGLVAEAIGTVWIDQKDRKSRKAARDAIMAAPKYPPIVLFPEGGIGPAGVLRPFRYGAFEICRDCGVPFLPVAIKYSHAKAFEWIEGEPFHKVFWNIACTPGPITGEVIALEPRTPAADEDIPALATATHRRMAEVLGVAPSM
jgi:1-acyl-sn-glycerol-3-phosphate acyltransferase